MKILSYIIPLYNSAMWLSKCLCSVLNQDIPEEQVEIICVNDGSPDNSADIARRIAKEHPCIIVIDQENQGPSGARNTGMRAATGKYLCFVDPDDFVEPNVYGGLVEQMEAERLDMLRFNYQVVNENYVLIPKRPYEYKFDYTPQLMTGTQFLSERLDIACNIWRYVYRRNIIVDNNIWCFVGDYYDDTPWLPLVLMKAERMNICDTVVYNYLERSDSLVNARSLKAVQRKIDGVFLLLELLNNQLRSIDDENVIIWYKRNIRLAVSTLLTLIGIYHFEDCNKYLQKLNDLNVFPLYNHKLESFRIRCKITIINISPLLYLNILHIKHILLKK